MIGLALDAGSATAAIQSDGGDFIFGPNAPLPESGYREWLSAVAGLVASVPRAEAGMPVAVALPGIIQNDIMRVVAYSTLSQLGYMTVALGASAYSAAIFHLMTHAFFKALLFLAAGSVIIAMHHEQDIRKMGGLKKYMPITYWTSLIGSLALIGFPGTAGFYSKDLLIEAVADSHWAGQGAVYWMAYLSVLLGVFGAFFSGFWFFCGVLVFTVFGFSPSSFGAISESLKRNMQNAPSTTPVARLATMPLPVSLLRWSIPSLAPPPPSITSSPGPPTKR